MSEVPATLSQSPSMSADFSIRPRNAPESGVRLAEIKWKKGREREEHDSRHKIANSNQEAQSHGMGNTTIPLANELAERKALTVKIMRLYVELFLPLFFEYEKSRLDDFRNHAIQSGQNFAAALAAQLDERQRACGLTAPSVGSFSCILLRDIAKLLEREFDELHCELLDEERRKQEKKERESVPEGKHQNQKSPTVGFPRASKKGGSNMPFNATVLSVMIAAPSDIVEEKKSVRQIIDAWNILNARERHLVLLPIGWETHSSPEMGDRPQAIINKQVLEHCDLLIAVFWTRLGSPTGEAPSGTVEEIEKHIAAGKPVMLYFSDTPAPPSSIDEKQRRALEEFKSKIMNQRLGLCEAYSSHDEFKEKFRNQLEMTIKSNFGKLVLPDASGGEAVPIAAAPPLSDTAQQLLLEAAKSSSGKILCSRARSGLIVHANGKQLSQMGDARDEARWRAAIKELVKLGLIESIGPKETVFSMTDAGYKAAEQLGRKPAD